jgi:hypothetical protein
MVIQPYPTSHVLPASEHYTSAAFDRVGFGWAPLSMRSDADLRKHRLTIAANESHHQTNGLQRGLPTRTAHNDPLPSAHTPVPTDAGLQTRHAAFAKDSAPAPVGRARTLRGSGHAGCPQLQNARTAKRRDARANQTTRGSSRRPASSAQPSGPVRTARWAAGPRAAQKKSPHWPAPFECS